MRHEGHTVLAAWHEEKGALGQHAVALLLLLLRLAAQRRGEGIGGQLRGGGHHDASRRGRGGPREGRQQAEDGQSCCRALIRPPWMARWAAGSAARLSRAGFTGRSLDRSSHANR